MKRYFLAAAAALLLTGYASVAQESDVNPSNPEVKEKKDKRKDKDKSDKSEDRNDNRNNNRNDDRGDRKLREYDEIIIKRKNSDKDSKVTVEIKDDQVFVDGKPIDEYVDDEISVKMRSLNRYKLRSADSPFRFEGGDWQMDNDQFFGEQKAFLGVMTEGSSDGAKVAKVTENSGAAKAGLQKGDVITKINDKKIFDHEQLSETISALKPDDKITITYKRNGKENTATATLGKRMMPGMPPFAPNAPHPTIPPMLFDFDENHSFDNIMEMRTKPRLGIKAQDTEEGNGVKVLEVEEGSAAEKAGIKENDIITSFEGQAVNSAAELAKASKEAREKNAMKIELKRNGKPQTIEVKVPKKLKTANL